MSVEAETVKMPSTNLEAELKEVNKNLRSLNAAILGLDKKLEAIETNTRDDIKKMTWFKKRNDSVDVNVRISVVSVGDINTVQQQFNCEFYLTLRWEEPNLKHMIGRDEEIDWSNQWEPGIYFVDLIQIEKYERNETLCRPRIEDGPPEVMFYYHIRGTFKEVLDITHFPFDYQPLTLTLTTSWTWEFVTLQKDYETYDNIRTWNFAGKNEWKLEPHVLTESSYTCKEPAASDNIFPIYQVKMHALRKYAYFIYNVALIMDFLSALSFTSYTVDASNPGERIQISLTLLLTAVALKYVVNAFVPQVPYPTLLDKFILCCMSFQFLVAVENALAAVIHIKYPNVVQMFEWISFGGLLFTFILLHIIFGAFWWKYTSSSKRLRVKHHKQYMEIKKAVTEIKEHYSRGIRPRSQMTPPPHVSIDIESDDSSMVLKFGKSKLREFKNKLKLKRKANKEKTVKSGALQYRI